MKDFPAGVYFENMFLMDKEQRLAYIMNLKTMMDEANHDAGIERAAEERGLKKDWSRGGNGVGRKNALKCSAVCSTWGSTRIKFLWLRVFPWKRSSV